jgi:hypothetical protein
MNILRKRLADRESIKPQYSQDFRDQIAFSILYEGADPLAIQQQFKLPNQYVLQN